jgi:hypothetical protein
MQGKSKLLAWRLFPQVLSALSPSLFTPTAQTFADIHRRSRLQTAALETPSLGVLQPKRNEHHTNRNEEQTLTATVKQGG